MFEPKSLLKNGPGFRSCLARLAIHSPSPMATASGGALSILEPSQARGAPCAPLPLALTVPAGALPPSPAQARVELGPRSRLPTRPGSGAARGPLPAVAPPAARPAASTCASLPPASAAFPATARAKRRSQSRLPPPGSPVTSSSRKAFPGLKMGTCFMSYR